MHPAYFTPVKLFCGFLLIFIYLPGILSAQGISRIGNSPYPTSATPDTLFMVHIDVLPSTQQLAVVTLQGLLSRVKPLIMVTRGAQGYINDLAIEYGVTYDSTYFTDFRGLMTHFKPRISGYILCNASDTSTSAAISACSMLNAVAVNIPDTALMDSIGISLLYDARSSGMRWSFDSFQNSYNKKIMTIQDYAKSSYLCDYSIFAGAYQFYDFPEEDQAVHAFSSMQTNGAVFGWFDAEQDLVTETSQHGVHMHASDWSNNLSVYTNFSIPQQHQIYPTTDTVLRPGVHTVCFMMTDGDNIQWLGGGFENVPNWYGNPHRGQVNLGWTISPALSEIAPTQMKYIYDSATVADGFVCAPSGLGYSYPDYFSAPDSGAAITSRIMTKADLSILNVIAGTYIPSTLEPYLNEPNIDAVLYYTYDGNYYQGHGFTDCINGKPVISARFNLVQPDFSTLTLAQALDTMPKNPYSSEGYSLIAVNVWSSTVDSVIKCVQLLDSNVRVVTPASFVKLYMAGNNCIPQSSGIRSVTGANGITVNNDPNPCSDHMDITYSLPQGSNASIALYDQYGREVRTLSSDYSAAGTHQVNVDTHDLSSGIYYYTLRGDYFSASKRFVVLR